MPKDEIERQFSGVMGKDYEIHNLICPNAVEMRSRIGLLVASFDSSHRSGPVSVVEIGCGSGWATVPILESREDLRVVAIDNEPTMLSQAETTLANWLDTGRISLIEADAVSAVAEMPSESVDIVASVYVIHNLPKSYRSSLIREVFRVLRPNGLFLNGDRYALDDIHAHTEVMQREARHYIKTLSSLGRYDLLEEWITHLFGDENPDRIMRETTAISEMKDVGFRDIKILFRDEIDALVHAMK